MGDMDGREQRERGCRSGCEYITHAGMGSVHENSELRTRRRKGRQGQGRRGGCALGVVLAGQDELVAVDAGVRAQPAGPEETLCGGRDESRRRQAQ